jgi:XrtN system VIT domain protein
MHAIKAKLQDTILYTGIILLLCSASIFAFPLLFQFDQENYLGLFFFHFAASVIYFFIQWLQRSGRVADNRPFHKLVLLMLFLISAYALNRCMDVFAASPFWLCCTIVLICINYMLSIFFEALPNFLRHVVLFVLGISVLFFLYLSVYLLPLYGFSFLGLLLLGISIHTFIPILFCVFSIQLLVRLLVHERNLRFSFYAGLVATFIFIAGFVSVWSMRVRTINEAVTQKYSGSDNMPGWIKVAQHIDQGAITEKILKTGLVYTVPSWNGDLFRGVTRTLGEHQLLHDPLIVIAAAFSGKGNLSEVERLQILKSQFGERHHTEERLWSGKDLTTNHIKTDVRIWPEYHLSYTEQVITVFNHARAGWQGRQEEAIYTFHLPEGGVVTALSLWIEGEERKGILTTKGKADSAYKTIVGVESRDPSVVHWQEGNRVSVRVFPILSNSDRVFKIGVTAPLRKEGEQLLYDNIWFEGPDASAAVETVQVKANAGKFNEQNRQVSYSTDADIIYEHKGAYKNRWSYAIKDQPVVDGAFGYKGHMYRLQPHQPAYASATITDLYLDINSSWTKQEVKAILSAAGNRKVWVYHQELMQLTEENQNSLFNILSQKRFTMFPVFLVQQPAQSLLISKTGNQTPVIADLEGSDFHSNLKRFLAKKERMHLFHLGHDLSPYLASLKELRSFHYESGDVAQLMANLSKNQYAFDAETANKVIVHNAGLAIVKQPGTISTEAPDHIMRLFAYHHLLQQYALQGVDPLVENDALLSFATEANIVTPVSSLIVLETRQDYERFDIDESKDGLKNASLKSKGAVPEPHEWIMIILFLMISFYLWLRLKS